MFCVGNEPVTSLPEVPWKCFMWELNRDLPSGSSGTSFSKMYALTTHYYSHGYEFYQRLSKITGDNIIYPTNLSDDPFNHMSQQNLNENFIIDENNNNLENENENENNKF
ncbi:hypothetical protein ACTFIT_007042 [Dictyostelium discoideum]